MFTVDRLHKTLADSGLAEFFSPAAGRTRDSANRAAIVMERDASKTR
jgi:hypothetical protein